MSIGQFGAASIVATFQGFYSTTNPARDANNWVARAQWGCTVTMNPTSGGAKYLDVTLNTPVGGGVAPDGGIDDANFLIVIQQFGRAPVEMLIEYGVVPAPNSDLQDATNIIEMRFGTNFVTDENLVAGVVFQTVPSINQATGNYNPGGIP